MSTVKALLMVALLSVSAPTLLVRAEEEEDMEIVEDDEGVSDEEDGDEDIVVDDEIDEFDEYEGQWKPHPDVTTEIYFPAYPDKEFPMGEKISALIGFTNHGDEVFNVTSVRAFLQSPYDLDYYIQNFTIHTEGVPVAPGNQVSIEYQFEADSGLEPLEYWLSAQLAYNTSDDRVYISTVQNSTIKLIDTNGSVASNIAAVLGTFLAIGLACFAYWANFTKKGEKMTKKYTAAPAQTSNKPHVDDWNISTAATAHGKRKSKKSKK